MLTDISNEYLAMLKEYWLEEGVQNAIGRDSRILPKFDIVQVVGKEQCIAINSGFGGAISGDYTKALANIASQGDVQAFHYTPGRLFSLYKVSPAEYEVSKNYDGATMKIEGVKHAVSLQRLRKALSGTGLYGRGYGELCVIGVTTALSTSADTTYTVPFNVYMQITTGTKLAFKATVDGAEAATMTVTGKVAYSGGATGDITVRGDAAYTPAATDILAFAGATVLSSGNQVPRFPVGLAGAFPTVAQRSGATWTSFIGNTYYGVNRSRDVNGLAGAFVNDSASASATKKSTLKKALRIADANGSKANLIVLNDIDWESLSTEIETNNLYYSNTKEGGKKSAGIGFNNIDVNFYTSIVERVVPDSFCPKGTFYVLDTDTIKFLTFFDANPALKNTKDSADEPGKVMNLNETEGANKNSVPEPFAALVDGWLSSEPGHDQDGVATIISMNVRGTFACLNPSVNVVGHFKSEAGDNDVEFSA